MTEAQAYPLHGGQLRHIAERFNMLSSELLDFSANINPSGPPPCVLPALRASLEDLSTLTEYPDLEETELRRAIAAYAGTEVARLAVANGFVPLLEATLRALKVRSCLLPVPSFLEYRKTLERASVDVIPHPLSPDNCFYYDRAMLAAEAGAVLIANPQNPSGVCHRAELLCDLVVRASEKNQYVLLDEAFIDYVPKCSLTTLIDRFPNLIIFRSVTKFHGMPGMRVAYAIANPALALSITEQLPPWPITTLAARAVIAALGNRSYADSSRSENLAGRVALQSDLEAAGLVVYPASANFVLFKIPPGIDPDAFWKCMIVEHRIVLRSCANYEALAAGHFRAAVRTQAENDRLVASISKALVSSCASSFPRAPSFPPAPSLHRL